MKRAPVPQVNDLRMEIRKHMKHVDPNIKLIVVLLQPSDSWMIRVGLQSYKWMVVWWELLNNVISWAQAVINSFRIVTFKKTINPSQAPELQLDEVLMEYVFSL